MSETSACPLNDFFDIDEENNLDEIKKEEKDVFSGNFLSYIYNQFEFCCINFFDELKKKDKRKNITLKKNYSGGYSKNDNDQYYYNVFDKILKKDVDTIKEVSLHSIYFNPHADWCECAHEFNLELNHEEAEFCIFNFFLKMYRYEERNKDLLLSILLECLYSKKDMKKAFHIQKENLKFLKEIKNIETSNFKESLNELINIIENTNFIQFNTNEKKDMQKYYFKLYIIIKIKYPYGIYIFNCDDVYDIVVIDCNTFMQNKPKIMSFLSLRKFISFLNNIYSININEENIHDSFPIIVYESKECYHLSHGHLPLNLTVCTPKEKKKNSVKNHLNQLGNENENKD
ncbi:conserved Plasmodium protein, unknown function [Plasmodium reichenowi]|uniref:Uncharacterized protein n=1 Tax=Plasmodium reichenowi TaxID=5854 RepID=A0A2P9DBS2_PLARE|nr:conserved Plasmodium protein, unknown function [Plasmodium reichenowi]